MAPTTPGRGAHRGPFGGPVVPAGYKALNSFVRDDENALDSYQSIEKMTDILLKLHNLLTF